MRAYIDADILIWYLRGKAEARRFVQELKAKGEYELWVGAMQRAEVVFYMRPDEEKYTLPFLSQFATAPVNQSIIDRAGLLFRTWNPSHGVGEYDVILAATALETGGKIYCLNVKHYPMRDVIVQKAW
ncbi:MAG: PIN domain-containing protein [Candidatus Sumerlaeota bacterium]|nr:PIN domain-containing protein [Candidatus Sumerlaeota bacterium]